MLNFTPIHWTALVVVTLVAHFVGFHIHRRSIVRRLLVIREELDRIKLRQVTGRDHQAKTRELELMESADRLLGSIGIDPYEHLREGQLPEPKAKRP